MSHANTARALTLRGTDSFAGIELALSCNVVAITPIGAQRATQLYAFASKSVA